MALLMMATRKLRHPKSGARLNQRLAKDFGETLFIVGIEKGTNFELFTAIAQGEPGDPLLKITIYL